MAYPKQTKQEDPAGDSRSVMPAAPGVERVVAPQVTGVRGGAPRISTTPAFTPAPVRTNPALQKAWAQTGTPDIYRRTFQRTQKQAADPNAVAANLARHWAGAAANGETTPLPTPSTLSLEQASTYLKDLSGAFKAQLDAKFKTLNASEISKSRFWQMYRQYPEPAATLMARRAWTNQMVGSGPVADWMTWLKG